MVIKLHNSATSRNIYVIHTQTHVCVCVCVCVYVCVCVCLQETECEDVDSSGIGQGPGSLPRTLLNILSVLRAPRKVGNISTI